MSSKTWEPINNILNETIDWGQEDFKLIADERTYQTSKPKFHKQLEIKYCYEGNFSVRINNVVYTLEPGDIVVINPYELHENPNIIGSRGKYYLLIFDLEMFYDKLIKKTNYSNNLFDFQIKFSNFIQNNEQIQRLILDIVREMKEKKLYYHLALQECIEYLIVLLLREECKEEAKKDIYYREGFEGIIPSLFKIHNDYREKILLEDLAAECHMSTSNYCRRFKKVMGVTPIQYLLSYRLDIAETMLQNTQMTYEQIGELCGFEDISYFIRIYKKKKGILPSASRKK